MESCVSLTDHAPIQDAQLVPADNGNDTERHRSPQKVGSSVGQGKTMRAPTQASSEIDNIRERHAKVTHEHMEKILMKEAMLGVKKKPLPESIVRVPDPMRPLLPKLKIKSTSHQQSIADRLSNPVSRISKKVSSDHMRVVCEEEGKKFKKAAHKKRIEDPEQMISRLFYDEVKRREQKAEELFNKHWQFEKSPKKMSPEMLESSVERLCNQALDSKREAREKAEESLIQYEETYALTQDELDNFNQRNYYSPSDHKREQLAKLTDKYSFKRKTPLHAALEYGEMMKRTYKKPI